MGILFILIVYEIGVHLAHSSICGECESCLLYILTDYLEIGYGDIVQCDCCIPSYPYDYCESYTYCTSGLAIGLTIWGTICIIYIVRIIVRGHRTKRIMR